MSGVITIQSESQPTIRPTTSSLTLADRMDHFLARWGINRSGHRVVPGLYSLGSPAPDSPVFVTANYTLSFDALRIALAGIHCYILVLDTKGINVWCAAGKGTFGTRELVYRIQVTALHNVVDHRRLILPQLGAAGVAAHLVRQNSGFKVEYGPVRAADLPEYLRTLRATSEMRRVRFPLGDRIVLIPVEFVKVLLPTVMVAVILFIGAGLLAAAGAVTAVLAGVVLFPVLLPWLPTADFSTKGFILGLLIALPFALAVYLNNPGAIWWLRVGWMLPFLLLIPPVTAFLALNFTGSTPFTSVSGVKREIFTYFPTMAFMFGTGIVLIILLTVISIIGGL